MAKLGETIVSSAISGKPLTLSDKAFAAVGVQNDKVAALEGQVQALLALVAAQCIAPAPVEAPVDAPVAKPAAKEMVENFFEELRHALEHGKHVKLSGFGNFTLRDKPQRPGRNPKTGEEIPVVARRVVTFKPGLKLKTKIEEIGK